MSITIAMPRMSADPELTTAQSKYVESLARAGASVRWVELADPEKAVAVALECAGLLLPGGGDIHGALPPEETFLLRAFWEARRPILGICRGMQALNVFRGGTLRSGVPGHQLPEGDMVHPTRAEGLMAALLWPCPVVNSNHHQAVDRAGEGLRLCQWAMDGTAEALYAPDRPVLGVQWHPERQSFALRREDAADGAPVFRWFRDALTNGGASLYNGN